MTFLRLTTLPRRHRLSAAALALSFAVPFTVTFDRAGTGAVTAPASPASARPASVASSTRPAAARPALAAAASIADARGDMKDGSIETFAGPTIDGDPASGLDLTSFDPTIGRPFATTDDGAIVFVARNQIFRIGTDAVVHRLGGTGIPVDSGDDGPAVAAGFVDIRHLDLDAAGNVVVTQVRSAVEPAYGPSTVRLRRIDIAAGTVTTIAEIERRACPASVLATVPTCVVKDARWGRDGSVYLQLGTTNDPTASPSPIDELDRVAVLRPGATAPTLLAGNGTPFCPSAPSTGTATDVAFCGFDVAPGDSGELYAIQPGPAEANRRIVKIGTDGEVSPVAGKADGSTGDGVAALTARLDDAHDLQVTSAGALFFAVSDGSACCTIRRISGGTVDTVAGAGSSTDNGVPTKTSVASAEFAVSRGGGRLAELVAIGAPARKVFRSAGVGGTVRTVTGRTAFSGVLPRPAGVLCAPGCGEWSDSIAIGPDDSVFVRTGTDLVRIDPDGNVTRALPNGLRISVYSAFTTAPDGTLFYIEPDPQSDTPLGGVLAALHPDGSVQRGVLLNSAHKSGALAADGDGNVYQIVGDTVVKYVDVNGFFQYDGKVAGGASCDSPTAACAGADGQPAAEVPLFGPTDIEVDSAGRLHIVETDGAMVRRVEANGTIRRIAGTGVPGTSGDGGQARVAKLERPTGISVGPFDWIYVADAAGSVVRRIKPSGLITTVAGNGTATGSTRAGTAVKDSLVAPIRLAVDSGLYTYVLDAGSSSVRRIAPGQDPDVLPTPSISQDSHFVAVPPTRILDTRSNLGGKGPLAAKGQLSLTVTGAHGDAVEVPAEATAVAMNVTITEAAAPGFVQVFPTDDAEVGDSSNLNVERRGQTLPNLVITRIGTKGTVTFYTQGGGQLVADLVGYFVPVPGPVADGRYNALTPTRILDTRSGLGQDAAHKPAARESVALAVLGAGGVPADGVSAVVMNVTATEATAPGFVQVIPTGGATALGASSNLNVTAAGQTIPNLVIVPVGADGTVTLYTQNGTHLVADVAGWFTDDTADPSETGQFVATTPQRLTDTRGSDGKGVRPAAAASVVVEPIRLTKAVLGAPDGQVSAVFANITATEAAAAGYVQGFPTGQAEPGSSSNLNLERRDQTIANAAVLTLGNGDAFTLFTQNGTHLVADMAGWFKK